MSIITNSKIDINKALDMLEKRKLANKKYYMKKHNIDGEALILNEEHRMIERANKQILLYQKQLARQKQQRIDAGPKKQGRPFKSSEKEDKAIQLLDQLNDINTVSLKPT